MAKGQKRSTREPKKPKKKKEAVSTAAVDYKGIPASSEPTKKKKG